MVGITREKEEVHHKEFNISQQVSTPLKKRHLLFKLNDVMRELSVKTVKWTNFKLFANPALFFL